MRIFLSYASDDRSVAERINLALNEEGHDVFFDRTDLPPGEGYNKLIRDQLRQSDRVVFLLSPASVTPGRYTLTELRFAEQKWPHPQGRVLPVMIAPTDFDDVPNYLKAVNILDPKGDVAAEVASVLARSDAGGRRRILVLALAFVILATVFTYLIWQGTGSTQETAPPAPPISEDLFAQDLLKLDLAPGESDTLRGQDLWSGPVGLTPSCATAYVEFSWRVRAPFPYKGDNQEDLEIRQPIPRGGGPWERLAIGIEGSERMTYCGEIEVRNNSLSAMTIQIRYGSGAFAN